MTKDVFVRIGGLHFSGAGHDDNIEVIAKGKYYFKNDRHYVIYDEMSDGSENAIHNVVKFSSEKLELKKSGLVGITLIFEKDKKNPAVYDTPYGKINLSVETSSINIEESEEIIKVKLNYSLNLDYEFLANCSLTMTIESDAKPFRIIS